MEHLLTPGMKPFFHVAMPKVLPFDEEIGLSPATYKQSVKACMEIQGSNDSTLHANIWMPYLLQGLMRNLCAWLLEECFFKRLEVLLGDQLCRSDFIQTREDQEVLTTARLEKYLRSWRTKVSRSTSLQFSVAAELHRSMTQDHCTLTSLDQFLHDVYQRDSVPLHAGLGTLGKLHYALVLFHLAIDCARAIALVPEPLEQARKPLLTGSPNAWMRHRLKSAGWCPYTARRLLETPDASVVAVGFAMGTLRTEQNHNDCSDMLCGANRAPDGAAVQHVDEGCRCSIIEAPLADITRIIRNEGVPVLQVTVSKFGVLKLKAVPKSDGHPYLAVSHVWADGLGSPTANTIATCQLVRLHQHLPAKDFITTNRAKNTGFVSSTPMALWIDTLCIPTDHALQSLRNAQIAKMRGIYRSARAVMVLDKDLLRLLKPASPLGVNMAVYLSAWNTRLWTYQESALNDHLLLLTSDGLVDFDDSCRAAVAYRKDVDKIVHKAHREFTMHIALKMGRANRMWPRHSGWHPRQTMWALEDRASSRAADETLVIAAFLNLSVAEILEASGQEGKMIALLRACDRIPADLPFTLGPRLSTPGFRWAPASLLRSRGASMRTPTNELTSVETSLVTADSLDRARSTRAPERHRLQRFGTSTQVPMGGAPAADPSRQNAQPASIIASDRESLKAYLPAIRLPRPVSCNGSKIGLNTGLEAYSLEVIPAHATTASPALTAEVALRHNKVGDRHLAILLPGPLVRGGSANNAILVELQDPPSVDYAGNSEISHASFLAMAHLCPVGLSFVSSQRIPQTEKATKAIELHSEYLDQAPYQTPESAARIRSEPKHRIKPLPARWWILSG